LSSSAAAPSPPVSSGSGLTLARHDALFPLRPPSRMGAQFSYYGPPGAPAESGPGAPRPARARGLAGRRLTELGRALSDRAGARRPRDGPSATRESRRSEAKRNCRTHPPCRPFPGTQGRALIRGGIRAKPAREPFRKRFFFFFERFLLPRSALTPRSRRCISRSRTTGGRGKKIKDKKTSKK